VPRYQFQRRARAALLDQLAAAGLPGLPVEMDGDYRPDGTIVNDTTCWVTAAPEQFDAVAAVVAAHDAAALDAAAAATKQQDSGDLTKVRAAYQTLRSNADALRADAAAMPATLTAAQVRARLIQIEGALADVSDATASLARYVGRRLG
jgi:uncharacterized protein (DUF362 family)